MGSLEELDNVKFVIYAPALPFIKENVNKILNFLLVNWHYKNTREN